MLSTVFKHFLTSSATTLSVLLKTRKLLYTASSFPNFIYVNETICVHAHGWNSGGGFQNLFCPIHIVMRIRFVLHGRTVKCEFGTRIHIHKTWSCLAYYTNNICKVRNISEADGGSTTCATSTRFSHGT